MKQNKIYITQNVDKTKHEHWGDANHPTSDLINFPKPYRMLVTAMPNCGKTMLIQNILIHTKPVWDNIFIMHCDIWTGVDAKDDDKKESFLDSETEFISEYQGIKAVYLKAMPPLVFWNQFKDQQNLLIIDDVNLKQYASKSKARMDKLDKLYSFISTHKNLSIISAFQSIYAQATPSIYRFCNIFIIWKMRDRNMNTLIARNTGIENNDWKRLMSLLESPYDNICIDDTLNSPARLRFNLTNPIVLRQFEIKSVEKKEESKLPALTGFYLDSDTG